jgi:hypothetical protein
MHHLLLLHLLHSWIASAYMSNPSKGPVPTGSATSESVRVALITAGGVVFAAAITALASSFQRERASRGKNADPGISQQYLDALLRDQEELRKIRRDYSFLREGCFENNLDPDVLIDEQAQDSRHAHD